MLMDAPPPNEDPAPFLRAAKWLDANGMRAPHILAEDAARGLVLLEDFGEARMRDYLDQWPGDERDDLHGRGRCAGRSAPAAARAVPRLRHERIPARGAAVRRMVLPGAEPLRRRGRAMTAAWEARAASAAAAPAPRRDRAARLSRREHHAAGLRCTSRACSISRTRWSAIRAYDLVSLLQDARRDVSPELEAEMFDHYVKRDRRRARATSSPTTPGSARSATPRSSAFSCGCGSATASRATSTMIPRVWALLERDLAHPALAPVARWFEANIPADLREAGGGQLRGYERAARQRHRDGHGRGLGKRMRPLTATSPSRWSRVAGKPLIDHGLDQLARCRGRPDRGQCPLSRRCARSASRRAQAAISMSRFRTSATLLLETGGGHGPGAAADRRDPFFCLNGDNSGWTDRGGNAFARPVPRPGTPARMDALLLVVPHRARGQLRRARAISTGCRWAGSRARRAGRIAPFIYTGIQLIV